MATPTMSLNSKAVKAKLISTNIDERTITAVVSSSNLDRDYERVDVPTLRLPLKGGGEVRATELTGEEAIDIPMLLNHSFDVEDVIGSVRKAYMNEAGELVVEFGVSGRAKAQDLMTLIDEGHLDNAFSITMNDYTYDDSTLFNAEIVEISLVFRGSNKDARILAVKSMLKGESKMSKDTEQSLAEKKAELERLQTEIAEAEKASKASTADDGVEPVVNPTQPIVPASEPAKPEKLETEVVPTGMTEVVVPPTEEVKPTESEEESNDDSDEAGDNESSKSIKKEKEDSSMSDNKEIATKQVVKSVPTDVEQPVATKKINKKAIRELYVKQMNAYLSGNKQELAKLNEKAMEISGHSSKAITYADGASIFQSETVSSDIRTAYNNVGRVGALVNRVDVTGAEKWSQLHEASGTGFQPVGAGEVKPEDKPVWTKLSIEPKEHAMVVAWFDGMAKRTPLAVYEQIVRYIAREYAKLEDKIVLSFEGVTTAGGDVFEATGLVPILTADTDRVVEAPDYTSGAVQAALGAAYGLVESDDTITIATNRRTWARLATSVDTAGRNVFTVVGSSVSAGALGTFNVVLSQEIDDNLIVVGAFQDYTLVTNGGLETLFSQEATVGSLNLYMSDASAVRANVDIGGKPVAIESFALLDFTAADTPEA